MEYCANKYRANKYRVNKYRANEYIYLSDVAGEVSLKISFVNKSSHECRCFDCTALSMDQESDVSKKAITILIADDFEIERACYRRYLEKAELNYSLSEAESGEDVIYYCGRYGVEAILLDYHLPDISAAAVIKEIHEISPEARPVIIVMVDECDTFDEIAAKMLGAGAQKCLVKEKTTSEMLQAAINDAIREKEAAKTKNQYDTQSQSQYRLSSTLPERSVHH